MYSALLLPDKIVVKFKNAHSRMVAQNTAKEFGRTLSIIPRLSAKPLDTEVKTFEYYQELRVWLNDKYCKEQGI